MQPLLVDNSIVCQDKPALPSLYMSPTDCGSQSLGWIICTSEKTDYRDGVRGIPGYSSEGLRVGLLALCIMEMMIPLHSAYYFQTITNIPQCIFNAIIKVIYSVVHDDKLYLDVQQCASVFVDGNSLENKLAKPHGYLTAN